MEVYEIRKETLSPKTNNVGRKHRTRREEKARN